MNSALFHLGVMDAGHSQAVRPPPRAEHAQGAQCRRRARRRGPGAAYALGGKALEAYGEGAPPISPKGEMDLPKPCTPFPQTVKCIKGTVTYQLNTPYGPPEEKPRRRKAERAEIPEASRALLEAWAEGKPPTLRAELENFVSARMEEKKARHAPTAYKAILNRLDRFSGGSDEARLDMLSLAASRGWITVYPPRARDKPADRGGEGRWDVE